MGLFSSSFGIDSESALSNYFGGVGRAILGRSNEKFNFNRNYTAANQRVVLVDVSFNELIQVAQNVPHLNTVISRGAEMFSNMKITHVDKNDKEILNSPVLQLLNKPNPLQSIDAFIYDFYVYNAIYSENFGYKNYGSSLAELPSVLWWLPPGWMKKNLSGKIYRQTKIEDIIENYTLMYDPIPFEPKEIIHITDGIRQNIISRGNRLEVLQLPLSNIMAALKSQNTITTERGMIGFISNKGTKDMSGGAIPMSRDEKISLQKQYRNDNGLDANNGHVGIFQSTLEWTPMTFDVKQLMLFEGLEDAFCQICGAYGLDRKIFPQSILAPSGLGTTTDIENALKATYQNSLQPLANKLMNRFSEEFRLTEKGEKLVASYDHMPVMKEDQLVAEQAFNQNIQGLSKLLMDGVISHEQYAERAGVEFDGKGETIPEPIKSLIPPIK